jgi:hypothetical protein
MPEILGAGRRQRDLARGPVEEPQAEPLFEPLDMRRDHGARHAELIGGAGEGTELGDASEGAHGLEVFHSAIR